MNKMKLFLTSIIGLLCATSAVIVINNTSKGISTIPVAKATECSHHHGYHYALKEATIDQPGHKEFWACCECHHQYLVKPEGDFIDRDDSLMIGIIDENHIAYLPPANSGGGDGDYWVKDPFDE